MLNKIKNMETKMKNRKHTHKGTCQSCGSVQAVMVDGNIADHGYKVDWGRVGSCDGSHEKPMELSCSFANLKLDELNQLINDNDKLELIIKENILNRGMDDIIARPKYIVDEFGARLVDQQDKDNRVKELNEYLKKPLEYITIDRYKNLIQSNIDVIINLKETRHGKPLYEAAYVRNIVKQLEDSMSEVHNYCESFLQQNRGSDLIEASRQLYRDVNNNNSHEEFSTSLGLVKIVSKYNGVSFTGRGYKLATFKTTFYLDGEKITKKELLAK